MIKNKLNKNNAMKSPQVVIVDGFEDVDKVIELLHTAQPVIINLAKLSRRDGYRIIDFLCGYCFAKNGVYRRIDDMIYRFEL